MLQIVNQSQGKFFGGGEKWKSKSVCRRGCLQSRLPLGYLQTQFRRLRTQKDLPFIRVVDRDRVRTGARGAAARSPGQEILVRLSDGALSWRPAPGYLLEYGASISGPSSD